MHPQQATAKLGSGAVQLSQSGDTQMVIGMYGRNLSSGQVQIHVSSQCG